MSNIQYYIPNVDEMVLEYLIYRGFTSTYKSLVSEKSKDRTKQFEVTRIVESIFMYLQNFEIESFISLWDFLSKRFFFHLDSEHLNLSSILKSDLLKFYLVNAIKQRSKDRITEFFSMYSHEILSESGDTIAGSLREWFVLPYLDEPEKDAAFTVYFSSKWSDALRLTLTNFLSIVLSSSPPPKLLLLERWFRAEAQQELRTQLKLSSLKVDTLLTKLESNGERVSKLINVIKDLVIHFQKSTIEGRRSSATSVNAGLFETDEVAEKNKIRSKELGVSVCKLATDLANKSLMISTLPFDQKIKEIVGIGSSSLFSKKVIPNNNIINSISLEAQEADLISGIEEWLLKLSN